MVYGSMQSDFVQLPSYFKGISEITKQLDSTNLKILSSMSECGPRNLLEVSRRTGVPFTSVYHRVGKLQAKSGRIAYLMPETSKLGLVRVVVLVSAKAGSEDAVNDALRIPNLWRVVNSCEGSFTHLSAHAVPVKFLREFKKYIRRMAETGLITSFKIIVTGDSIPNFPNFKYYDSKLKRWSFPWARWLAAMSRAKPTVAIEDPVAYPMLADAKDLLIIKELEKNGRKSFADLAPILGMSLQAVKYRYDQRLRGRGIVRHFAYDVYPYPVEVSAFHEVMLEFPNDKAMKKFLSIVDELFFVHSVAKVLNRNTLLVRTYIPTSQLSNMFAFFSNITNLGLLTTYSSLRLDFAGRETQTISFELFDDEKGWTVDFDKCASKLNTLTKAIASPRAQKTRSS